MKTTTMLHGVPQNRIRSFYFFWKSETSPILNWYSKKLPSVASFLQEVVPYLDKNEVQEKTEELQTDPLYIWLKQEFTDWRSYMKEKKGSMMDVMISSGRAKEYFDFAKNKYPEHTRKAEHAFMKRSKGMARVFQNVPSATAADWTREVVKFINGELFFQKVLF